MGYPLAGALDIRSHPFYPLRINETYEPGNCDTFVERIVSEFERKIFWFFFVNNACLSFLLKIAKNLYT